MLQKFTWKVLLLLTLAFPFSAAYSWWDAGHKTIAEIAYADLTPEAKESVDEIVKAFHTHNPSYKTFADLATWPDHLKKEEKAFLYTDLHFIVLPYDSDGILSKEKLNELQALSEKGALASIQKAKEVLSSTKASMNTKFWALSYLAHVVADLHQPLHCCTRFSTEMPEGDFGGNLHKITSFKGSSAKNLHQLWDSGSGLLPTLSGKEKADAKLISLFAKKISQDLPKDTLYGIDSLDPSVWVQESHSIAKEHVYTLKVGTEPTKEYLVASQAIAKKRIALASYRLSGMLNVVFSKDQSEVPKG
ncbi:MAG: S1/P1 nuclease [Chlamydiae bacterium]|nr:S1/P1 nuclease [Chlamydiota bacterium]